MFNGDDVSQKAGQIVEIPIKSEDLFDRTFDCYTRFDRILIPQRRSSSHELTPNRCVLLSCGLYGNVIRLLPPLSATDEELERGLGILEEALGDASSG